MSAYPTLSELIDKTSTFQNRTALMVPRKDGSGYEEATFGEIGTWSKHLAAGLQKHGVQPDDKVALISKPRLEWAIGFNAVLRIGAVAVPIDSTLTPTEVERLFVAADVKWVLADGEWIKALGAVDGLKDRTNLEQLVAFNPVDVEGALSYGELMADEGEPEPAPRKLSDLALLMCTSGTTGDSKAVMLTHENLSSNVTNALEVVNITTDDILVEIAPWNHIFGVLVLLVGIRQGCKIIYTDDYRRLPELMSEQGVTILVGVPKLFHGVFAKLEQTLTASFVKGMLYKLAPKVVGKKVIERFGGKLRFVVSGSAPLDPKVMQGFRRLGIGVMEGYGMTETSPVLSASTAFNEKYGSVGPAIPSLELKIDQPNEEGIGEVVVRGPNVTQGYFRNEERTKEAIDENGWLHTGDLGMLDSENWLYIKGRKKNVIVLESGKNVYPEELEFQFMNIPEIAEVMATSGERKGVEVIKVFVYPDPEVVDASMPKDELKSIIWKKIREESQQLAQFKRPKSESDLILLDDPFEKTSTLDIKRYLYAEDAPAAD